MSYAKIRIFYLYSPGLESFVQRCHVKGLHELAETSTTHTLVYVPSHRSHVDYLVLSYALYTRGLMIPHIAAGDN